MACENCGAKEVIISPRLCKSCFLSYFEDKVLECIRKFDLLDKSDKVVVAVSGGKDSTVLLYLLNRFGYTVEALAIDEGIRGYRDISLAYLKKITAEQGIRLRIISFKDEFGLDLDDAVKRLDIGSCHLCGVFRRYLLNRYSKSYSKIAVGHNLDDECQNIMMNMLKGNTFLLAKLGPKTGVIREGFTQRVKPLYFLSNKEVRLYAFLKGIAVPPGECPYSGRGLRGKTIDILADLENNFKGCKRDMLDNFIRLLPRLRAHFGSRRISSCRICNEPSAGEICHTCKLRSEINY